MFFFSPCPERWGKGGEGQSLQTEEKRDEEEKEKNANYGGWVVGGGRGENGDTRGEGTGGTGVEEKET